MTAVPPFPGSSPVGNAEVRAGVQLRARWFWLACLLLSLLLVVPLWVHEYPGMTDYLNHLARAQLIVDEHLHRQAHPYYVLRHALIGNLALDTLVPLWVHAGMSTNDALRLFAGLALLLPIAGVIALASLLQRGTPWLALFVFALAHSRYFAWGFLNYFFSLGVALLVFTFWLWLREKRIGRAALALALLGPVVMSAHLMGFGVLVLLVLSHEGWLFWRRRAEPLRERCKTALPTLAALAACALLYLSAFERALGLDMQWYDTLAGKLRNLTSPFMAYDILSGVAVMALVVGVMLWLWRTRRAHLQPGWWAPVGVLVATFVVMPSVIMNSHYAGSRLIVVAAFMFLAFATLRADRRAQSVVIMAALAATSIRLAEVHTQWAGTSARTAEMREALRAVPQRAKVATVVSVGELRRSEVYPLRHVAAFAITDRDAFVPNFFGFPFNGESVAFRPEAAAIASATNKDELVFWRDKPIPWDSICSHYDVLLVIEEGHRPTLPACVTGTLRSGPGFGLYALRN